MPERSAIAPALVSPGSTRVLESNDPAVQVISRRGAGRDLWVIAASAGEGSRTVTISGLPLSAKEASVYTEGRSIAASGGSFTDTFERSLSAARSPSSESSLSIIIGLR